MTLSLLLVGGLLILGWTSARDIWFIILSKAAPGKVFRVDRRVIRNSERSNWLGLRDPVEYSVSYSYEVGGFNYIDHETTAREFHEGPISVYYNTASPRESHLKRHVPALEILLMAACAIGAALAGWFYWDPRGMVTRLMG